MVWEDDFQPLTRAASVVPRPEEVPGWGVGLGQQRVESRAPAVMPGASQPIGSCPQLALYRGHVRDGQGTAGPGPQPRPCSLLV